MTAVAVRIAVPGDLNAIAAIYAETFDAMQPRLAVEQFLRPDGTWALIATRHVAGTEVPAGFVLARSVLDEAELLAIGVALAHRRRGVGTVLMAALAGAAAARGARTIYLEVAVDNAGARALYGKIGYEIVGRRPDYYRDAGGKRVAALVLRCSTGNMSPKDQD